MLKNRVLASFGALFACGAAVAVYLENYIPLFLFLVAGVLCGYLCIARLLRRKPRIRRTLAYAAAPLLAIAFTFVYRALFITPYYALDGVAVKGAGTVVEVREYAAGGYLEVEIEEADTPLAEGLTVRLYLADGANLPACGFTVEFEATLRVPENGTGMAADRVLLVGTQAKLRSVWYPSGALWKLRYAVSRDIEEMYGQFGKEVPAVIKATVVNNTTGLTDDVYAAFRDTGTAHLIAISGQHFSILIMSIYGVLCALGMGRKPRSLVCSVLAILYAAFVGFTPSVVRAAIMLLIVFLVFLSMREPDGLSSLFFALIVLLVLNPYSIASVSLQLSFLSCLGILLVGTLMNDFFSLRFGVGYRLLEFFVTPIVYSVVAALFTFPVTLTVFDTVSIISPLANLLSGALFTLLLVLALISVALYPLLGSAAVIVYYPCGCLAKVILALIDWLATLPFASMPSSAPHLWPAMLAAVLSIAALIAFRKSFKYIVSAVLAVSFFVTLGVGNAVLARYLKEHTIIELVEQPDMSQLYIAAETLRILIDFGGTGNFAALPAEHYETGVDVLVLLAPDESSYGRVRTLLATTEVSRILFPTVVDPRYAAADAVEQISLLAEDYNCAILYREETYRFQSGGTEVLLDTTYTDDTGAFAVSVTTAGNRFLYLNGQCGPAYNKEHGRRTQVLAVSGDAYFMPETVSVVLYGAGVDRIRLPMSAYRRESYAAAGGFTVIFGTDSVREVIVD